MNEQELLSQIHQAMNAAKSALGAAENLTTMLSEKMGIEVDKTPKGEVTVEFDGESKNLEGVFGGQNMETADGTQYPVPANYASKSKLVEGDGLKLTIQPNGSFVYKQITQVPRVIKKGHLILDGSQYKVLAEGKTYDVLYASVTFFRGKVGDEVAMILPENQEAQWAAIENIIPSELEKTLN